MREVLNRFSDERCTLRLDKATSTFEVALTPMLCDLPPSGSSTTFQRGIEALYPQNNS